MSHKKKLHPLSPQAGIAINEPRRARTVQQLVADLARIQQVVDDAQRGKSQRI